MPSSSPSRSVGKGPVKLSLIIPCYNEARNLPLIIDRCRDVFSARRDCEVVFVDNGSTDATAKILPGLIAPHAFARSLRVDVNQGYGHGILEGLRSGMGEILGWTHADMQTDPRDALRGLELFETAPDPEALFVKGRRRGRPLGDQVFTLGMSVFETVLMRKVLIDINAQPTMFPRAFFAKWSNPPKDFSLDLFAYCLAKRSNLRVQRLDVRFGERAHGISHWNISPAAKLRFVKRIFSYSFELARRLNQK
jgi:glycosyltransferase involved in cell wall biosynthesis